MREITIRSEWRASVVVEVEDDAEITNDNFDDWPEDVLDQITNHTAELVDWEVIEK